MPSVSCAGEKQAFLHDRNIHWQNHSGRAISQDVLKFRQCWPFDLAISFIGINYTDMVMLVYQKCIDILYKLQLFFPWKFRQSNLWVIWIWSFIGRVLRIDSISLMLKELVGLCFIFNEFIQDFQFSAGRLIQILGLPYIIPYCISGKFKSTGLISNSHCNKWLSSF
jgi:hypothetical protein